MRDQRMFAELAIGARFTFDHDADSGFVWTKTSTREYSRIQTKKIGSTSAPVTPVKPEPTGEGEAVVMLKTYETLVADLRALGQVRREDNDAVVLLSDLEDIIGRL